MTCIEKNNNLFCVEKIINALLFLSVPVITLWCFSDGISGNDFWWHIKVGENICQNLRVPTTDIFSWIGMQRDISWTAHEWLSDVIFYVIFNYMGQVGIYLFSILLAGLMIGLLWHTIRSTIKDNFIIGVLYITLFAVLTSLFFYGRPHIFSYFLLYAELKILYGFYENQDSRYIYFLPLIAILWSNLHGGSACLSYIICLIFFGVGILEFDYERVFSKRLSKKSIVKLGLISALMILGIFINPIGVEVFIYPFRNIADAVSMSVISEWQAPDAKVIGNLILYFLPIVVVNIGIVIKKEKVRFIDLFIMGIFLFLFLRSARFIVLWYIGAAFYAFRYIPICRVKKVEKTYEKIAIALSVILLSFLLCQSILLIVNTCKGGKIISQVISEEAISVVKEDNPKKIFNDYNLGETLIYNDIPVFFDARADLFAQDNIMADGISLMFLEQINEDSETSFVDVDYLLNKYNFDTIFILKVRPLYSYIIENPDVFQCVYEDNTVGYFRIRR